MAEELHFGRAAERLFLTPQALSKRIRRLEEFLAVPLFVRNTRAVELTEAGQGFLPHARTLVAVADETAAAARSDLRTFNIDAWSHEQFPWQISEDLGTRKPELRIELSTRRSLPRAMLQRGEIDAAFGRTHDLGQPWPTSLTSRPIYLQPFEAVLAEDHPLATALVLRPADLRAYGLWWATAGPPEAAGFARRFGSHFQIPVTYGGTNAGLQSFIEQVRGTPGRVSMITAGLELPLTPASGSFRSTRPRSPHGRSSGESATASRPCTGSSASSSRCHAIATGWHMTPNASGWPMSTPPTCR